MTVPFVCACGSCPPCLAGDQQVCDQQTQPGFTDWGSFAELVALDHADVNLVALPDDARLGRRRQPRLPVRDGLPRRARPGPGRGAGEWVAVHGCGGVGLSAVQIAVAAGARVVAVDVSPAALELAAASSAQTVPSTRTASATSPRAVVAATGGGAHVSIDALGSADDVRHSIRACASAAGTCRSACCLRPRASPPVPMERVIALRARDPRQPRHGRPRLPARCWR